MGRHLTIQSLLPVVFVFGCGTAQPAAEDIGFSGHRPTAKESIPAIRMIFEEQEPGIEPYRTRYLANGLPIQEWDQAGFPRFLVELDKDVRVAPYLFALPAEFRPYSTETESSDNT